ncbi:MAG: alpha/beta fold hydrolase [Chloroherpetonaceae bacterium]|nr:alpha/beta hydrolase [Chthonomonadaceae bacterium]MDW8208582.1 alpha/beta fold hydrolase [Chloroherpetonaceae bacterium]
MKLEVLRIPVRSLSLAGLRYVPEGTPRRTMLLYAHGFTSSKHSMDGLASYLAMHGYPGVTFDFVGHKLGATGGQMRHITDAAENLQDALHWIRAEEQARAIVLIGHSLGGASALQVAAWERGAPDLQAVIVLCMGQDPARGFQSPIGRKMLQMRQDYVQGTPVPQLLEELRSMLRSACEVGTLPVLFIAAQQDVLVTPERVFELAEQVGPHAEVQVIEAQHVDAPDRARGVILNWLEQHGLR